MSDKALKRALMNCFLDLQRAAVAFYQAPNGSTHQIFLHHSLKILDGIENKKIKKIATKVRQFAQKTASAPTSKNEVKNLADKILTLGLLLKP